MRSVSMPASGEELSHVGGEGIVAKRRHIGDALGLRQHRARVPGGVESVAGEAHPPEIALAGGELDHALADRGEGDGFHVGRLAYFIARLRFRFAQATPGRLRSNSPRRSNVRSPLPGVPGVARKSEAWCPGKDSNLHASRHTDLNRARLPIPPPGQVSGRHLGPRLWGVNAAAPPASPGCLGERRMVQKHRTRRSEPAAPARRRSVAELADIGVLGLAVDGREPRPQRRAQGLWRGALQSPSRAHRRSSCASMAAEGRFIPAKTLAEFVAAIAQAARHHRHGEGRASRSTT